MRLQRTTHALLKADNSSPLLSFLAPTIATSPSLATFSLVPYSAFPPHSLSRRRCLSSTLLLRAASSEAQARQPEDEDSDPPTQKQKQTPSPRPRFLPSNTPQSSQSRSNSPLAQKNPLTRRPIGAPSRSATDQTISSLISSLNKSGLPQSPRNQNRRPVSPSSSSEALSSALPPTSSSTSRTPQTSTSRRQADLARDTFAMVNDHLNHIPNEVGPPVPIDPYLGNAVPVNKTYFPLPRALAVLNGKLNENRIRQTQRYQKFHERPGLKRKRLRSERWRGRFKEGFRAMVEKVKGMRRQGW